MRGLQRDHVVVDGGVLAENRADLAQALLPRGAVEVQRRGRRQQIVTGLFAGEVGRGVFFLGADLLLGLHLLECIERVAIAAVGGIPERALNGHAVIRKRQREGGERAGAVRVMRVVERRRADTYLHIRCARMARARVCDGAVLRGDYDVLRIGHGVADEVGLLWSFLAGLCGRIAELGERAVHLVFHRLHEDWIAVGRTVVRGLCVRCCSRAGESEKKGERSKFA